MTTASGPAESTASWQREDIVYPSGTDRCAGWLYRPQAGAERRPAILLGHGFGGIKSLLAPYGEAFAAAGFVALAIDYRSFGDSSGTPRQVVKIKDQLEDLRRGLDFLAAHPAVDAQRLGIWGSSLGGGHALSVAASDRRVRAAVAQVPHVSGLAAALALGVGPTLRLAPVAARDLVAAAVGGARHYLPLLGAPGDLAIMTADASGAYVSYMAEFDPTMRRDVAAASLLEIARYSPATVMANVQCPLLMIVADRDGTAPAEVAVAAAAKAPNCEVLRCPVQHFDVYLPDHFPDLARKQAEFFARHLG